MGLRYAVQIYYMIQGTFTWRRTCVLFNLRKYSVHSHMTSDMHCSIFLKYISLFILIFSVFWYSE